MTTSADILYLLLRLALHEDAEQDVACAREVEWKSVDWREVCDLGFAHNVAAIAFDGVLRLYECAPEVDVCLPKGLKMRFVAHQSALESGYVAHAKAVARLAGFYARHNIPMMLLKGYGLSLHYPQPHHRPCGDMDIWLYGHQQQADDLLRQHHNVAIDEDKHHHTVFHIGGVMVENHYDFLNIHSHRSNRKVEIRLKQLACESHRPLMLEGVEVRLPSVEFNALFVLRHAAAHFAAAEINVRHVLDWALFVRACAAEIDWPKVRAAAREVGMEQFLNSVNAMSIDLLGFDSELFGPMERNRELEHRVAADILHPEFDKSSPREGFVRVWRYRLQRWWTNRWKHRIVYNDSLVATFFVQMWSHALKPKSIFK